VAAGLVLAGCSGEDGSSDDVTDDADHAHEDAADGAAEAFGHIHGLGVAGGVLHVATHYGLFAVSDGEVSQVSEDDHDFMGFTVVDDQTFLASGHPGSTSSDLPGNLGLLESTDGGRTWTDRSLAGEVDFHALDAKHDVVYGLDSMTGQLLASEDQQNWERFDHVPFADVSISPDDAATIVITTEAGPMLSQDGGASLEPLDDAPVVVLVDWPRSDELYGVAPDGTVHRSADDGLTWDDGASLSEMPQAMTVGPDGAVYVALATSIMVSSDGGDTFTEYHTWD
jgi:hypothetical protein